MKKIVYSLAGLATVLALAGCAAEEKTEIFRVDVNGKPVDCVIWKWVDGNGQIEESSISCDFTGTSGR